MGLTDVASSGLLADPDDQAIALGPAGHPSTDHEGDAAEHFSFDHIASINEDGADALDECFVNEHERLSGCARADVDPRRSWRW